MNEREFDETLQRPIVIVGAPRSGTTVLGRLLSAHPELFHVKEPRLTWRFGNDAKSDMLAPEDARPEVRRHIRSAFAAAIRQGEKQRLLEKTPSNSLRMGFVDRVLPGCLFVHIIRDSTESILAIRRYWQEYARGVKPGKLAQRMREINLRRLPYYAREFVRRAMPRPFSGLVNQPVWGPRIPGIDGLLKDLKLLEVCALQWRMCVEAACHYGRALGAERYLECRLEAMSPDLLKSIMSFCQLDESPEVLETFEREFDPAQTQHRRAAATDEDVELICKWTTPTITWLDATAKHSLDPGSA